MVETVEARGIIEVKPVEVAEAGSIWRPRDVERHLKGVGTFDGCPEGIRRSAIRIPFAPWIRVASYARPEEWSSVGGGRSRAGGV